MVTPTGAPPSILIVYPGTPPFIPMVALPVPLLHSGCVMVGVKTIAGGASFIVQVSVAVHPLSSVTTTV